MGYKPGKQIYNVTYAEFPGLALKCTSATIGKLMSMGNLSIQLNASEEEKLAVFTTFSKRVIEWNIDHPDLDDNETDSNQCPICGLNPGDRLPVSAKAMLCLDLDFALRMIVGWMRAVTTVSPGKEPNSNNGASLQEDVMRRLAELQSPVKLPTPNLSSD